MDAINTHAEILDQIIQSRRSVRNFKSDIPDINIVNTIIKSALHAPYGGATGIPLLDIRKVFVFKQDSKEMNEVVNILQSQLKSNSRKLNLIISLLPFLKKKMKPFANRVKSLSEKGIPSLSTAPYLIIVAEKKGFPPIEKQSIAHALQNMWLTTTSLGLGFQLISAFGSVSKNEAFLKLLDLPKNTYEFDGCVIGYPVKMPSKLKELNLDNFVTWISSENKEV